ncbi:hypothetical protein CFK39_11820 [Brachybacterium avium]|uniref:DUF3263 domain-containing protein n=1 Tax=Brachybacterium avium TaxID=2017485 RepID=A0A220UE17_9MICO|nr:DUF3263 domain-containing protein [Brachybacterium avium]ASK66389.1 hypothetical protein CFK39_11820 [Brachybacterium avium]
MSAVPDPSEPREVRAGAPAGAPAGPDGDAPEELSEHDRRILALEGRTFRYVGAKERAIREEIGISKVAYYVRLNALLDEPAALRAAPSLVHRLRGRRTSEPGAAAVDGGHRVA